MISEPNAISLPFQYDPANHRNQVTTVVLSKVALPNPQSTERNEKQLSLLGEQLQALKGNGQFAGTKPCVEKYTPYHPDPAAQQVYSFSNERIFRDTLYLFNVIVAIEWNPSQQYYQQIRNAFKQASNFLYDVTNGYAAIGQVVIGGPDLLPAADIQIMASNRLHPCAWVDALNKPKKFKPIRVGRGIWQKNDSILSPWDSPEGYRTLVHEWGHYAFALADEYLEPTALNRQLSWQQWEEQLAIPNSDTATELSIVAPKVALAVNTLMANTKISEFIEWPTIIQKLGESLNQGEFNQSPMEGPNALPLPLPEFIDLSAPDYLLGIAIAPTQDEGYRLDVNQALINAKATEIQTGAAQSHWLYLLKEFGNNQLPKQLIAQGKVGAADANEGFLLYGAADGDVAVLISQVGTQVIVQRRTIKLQPTEDKQLNWEPVTPTGIEQNFFIDVIPRQIPQSQVDDGSAMHADLFVHVETDGPKPDQLRIYPAGERETGQTTPLAWVDNKIGETSVEREVPHLDGHVLLRWTNSGPNGGEALFIASYSQGGGPDTSGGGRVPITAGSSDGNAMVFFRENEPPLSEQPDPQRDQGVRIVTTTLTVGTQVLKNQAEARSYIFSLASNTDLSSFPASLVLYYDREAPKRGGDLLIHRWDAINQEWAWLTTYSPQLPYVAIPLMPIAQTAPALMQSPETPAVERYRIFWVPTDPNLTG